MDKEKLINESINYIMKHFNEDISVKDVADYFNFSEFYFSRMFKEVTGQSIYAFIKKLKMNQSAVDIKLYKNKTITDIGLDYGYSASNYSSAFRKHHNISPTKFRKLINKTSVSNPFYLDKEEAFDTFEDYNSKISIKKVEDKLVFYKRFIGSYIELKDEWFKFIDKYKDYIKPDTELIEKFYDDPSISDLKQSICDLCFTVDEDCNLQNKMIIKGGKFIVYSYEGKISNIFATLQGVFTVWFPQTSYQMKEIYGFNIYKKIDRDNEYVSMDLYIPIK